MKFGSASVSGALSFCADATSNVLVTREIAAGAARDFAPCDVTKDVVLGAVGMQRNFGAVDHLEQFRLVGMKSCEQRSRVPGSRSPRSISIQGH